MNIINDLFGKKEGNFVQKYVISYMPVIMLVFANVGIILADIRAYDVLLRFTGVPWQALFAVLFSCAFPFILWELGWQYNKTTDNWRVFSLVMAFMAFATSVFFGVADYLGASFVIRGGNGEDITSDALLILAVILTGVHTIGAILYAYNDPDAKAKRLLRANEAAMAQFASNAKMAQTLLEKAKTVGGDLDSLKNLYGENEVQTVMAALSGEKTSNPTGGGSER
jgi:hypothetical protein